MRKTSTRRPRKMSSRKKKKSMSLALKICLWGLAFVLFFGTIGYHYREALAYYFSFTSRHSAGSTRSKVEGARIYQILEKHKDLVFGIDVSQYQSDIRWEHVTTVEDSFQLKFVFIRATAGSDKKDLKFDRNWELSKKNGFIRGAYHYYRPNENSIEQAENFIATVRLEPGDLPPVLDIENLPKEQSMDSLRVGLRRWLKKVEAHYKVRPIIYSGESYYTDFLKNSFKEYPFWIANYHFFVEDFKTDWKFWQFTEKAKIEGIPGRVDVNIYNGTPKMLDYLRL
jgi:lysozyme